MKSRFENLNAVKLATANVLACLVSLSRSIAALVLSVLALVPAASPQSAPAPQNEFVIRNARIFDGTRVIPKGDVWVQNGVIKSVGPQLTVPSSVRAIDGSGRTLLPGLIDTHVHVMNTGSSLRSALALGVTTEIDMGASPRFAVQIKKEQAEGKDLDMADLRSSESHPTAPFGHGTEYSIPIRTISSPEEAQDVIDAGIAEGDDFVGEIIYDDGSEYGLRIPTLSKELLRAVIEAAHRRGKLAVVHVLSLQAAKDAIAVGADGLAHVFADRPPDAEFLELAEQHHVFVIPTLSVLASAAGVSNGPDLASDPRLEPYLTSEAITDLKGKYPRNSGSLSYAEEAVRRLKTEGILILAGTDAHNLGTAHGASLLGELELLVNAGLTPAEALASATSINAAAFQMKDRGEIAPGKRADLLLVAGDPTTRISDVKNVLAVWKVGVEDDRATYRASLEKEKAAEDAARSAPPPAGSESGLISNFENGTSASIFGLGWTASTGTLLGGRKPVVNMSVVDGGSQASKKALQITGELAPGSFGWAGAMFFPGPSPMAPVNLSGKRAISFWTKGDGRTYQAMLWTRRTGSMPLTRSFVAGNDWALITIPISDFGTDGSDMQALMFAELGVPRPFNFVIDDVRLESTLPPAATAKPAAFVPTNYTAPLDTSTTTTTAAAKNTSSSNQGWKITTTSYMWLQGIHGDVSALGRDLGFKAGPIDLASRAKTGLQELVAVQHGRLSLTGDVLWTPVEIHNGNSLLNPAPAFLDKARYDPVIVTPEIGYRLIDARHLQIDGLTGFRYWRVGTEFTLASAFGGGTLSKTINWVDPLVGARIKAPLGRKLTAVAWGDVGGWGVGSQLDYQMAGALSYQIKPKWALDAGWRYMYTDYNDSQLHSRVAESGIFFGITYSFKKREPAR